MTTLKDFRTVDRSRLDYALVGAIILVIVFGLAKQLGQAGLVAGFAALLTYIAESPGSLRQRAGGMLAFAIFCFIQILLVALVGNSDVLLLILLFAVSFVCSWMMGFGIHIAKVAFLCNIWITILPGMGVTNDLAASLFGFVAGSMLVIVASIIPPLLRRLDQNTIGHDDDLVYEPRGYNISTLVVYSLVRAGAITIGGYIGQKYLEINQFWIAMTVAPYAEQTPV